MVNYKPISTPMPSRVKLTKDMNSYHFIEQNALKKVLYANNVKHFTCLATIGLNLSYLVGHCVQFMFNPDPIGE